MNRTNVTESDGYGLLDLVYGTLSIAEHPGPECNAWHDIPYLVEEDVRNEQEQLDKMGTDTRKLNAPSLSWMRSHGMVMV